MASAGQSYLDTSPREELTVPAGNPMLRCWQCAWRPMTDTLTGTVTAWKLSHVNGACPEHGKLSRSR